MKASENTKNNIRAVMVLSIFIFASSIDSLLLSVGW